MMIPFQQQQQQQQKSISSSSSISTLQQSNTHHNRRRQVCLFGLSADPPTGMGGHLGMVHYLTSSSKFSFDEIRILPVYKHMYAAKQKNQKNTSFHHRVQMCKLAFENNTNNNNYGDNNNNKNNKVIVSEAERICYEKHLKENPEKTNATIKIGTADLLDMFTTNEPDVDFTLALGSDTFIDLACGKWRRTEDIFRMIHHRIVVFHRKRNNKSNRSIHEAAAATTTTTEIKTEGTTTTTLNTIDPPPPPTTTTTTTTEEEEDDEDKQLLYNLIDKWQMIQPDTQMPSIQHVTSCLPTTTILGRNDVSSSIVRQHSTNTQLLKEMIPSSVLEYIKEHNLYASPEKKEEEAEEMMMIDR